MADRVVVGGPTEDLHAQVVGVFRGPWDTGWPARDGAVLGFEDIYRAFSAAADMGELKLVSADIGIFREYRRIRAFLAACDVVYANCGPWAALLYSVREREQLDVRIIREVRTVGWVGYLWQEEVAAYLERPEDQRIFPSRYARDTWDFIAPRVSDSRLYYPMIRRDSPEVQRIGQAVGTVGFFSAFSQDKGFDALPAVISRMRAAGNSIDRLVLAGNSAGSDLYSSVTSRLSDMGVRVSYCGGLRNGDTRELMAECDCILFLSVSSIESFGRVIVEACEQGVPVVTADFGAARDLVDRAYRIPVEYPEIVVGASDRGFPVARLQPERWTPPSSLTPDDCFLQPVEEYLAASPTAAGVFRAPRSQLPAQHRYLDFSYSCATDGLGLAERLLDEPATMRSKPIRELVDLGGALKDYLLSSGYNPQVTFELRGVHQSGIDQAMPDMSVRWAGAFSGYSPARA